MCTALTRAWWRERQRKLVFMRAWACALSAGMGCGNNKKWSTASSHGVLRSFVCEGTVASVCLLGPWEALDSYHRLKEKR